jgi:hypothetical protein
MVEIEVSDRIGDVRAGRKFAARKRGMETLDVKVVTGLSFCPYSCP